VAPDVCYHAFGMAPGPDARADARQAAHPENLLLGIVLTVLAFLAVAVMSALGKAASEAVPSDVLTLFQNAISLLLLIPFVVRDGIRSLRTEHFRLHLLRGVSGLLSQYLMFVALGFIPLVDAVLLANSAPLFIPMVAWAWLAQRVTGRLWLTLAVGFVGVVLILQPGSGVLSVGTPIALAAGACSAVALVAVGRLHLTEPPTRILFYYFLISTVLMAPAVPRLSWRLSGAIWLELLGVGVCMALAQLLLVLAYVNASPSHLAPFNYSVVVFSALLGWLLWHQVPNAGSLVGMILVCVAGVASMQQHGRTHGPLPRADRQAGVARMTRTPGRAATG
jgi:drug/metabolite transporter (DMT)-like permease